MQIMLWIAGRITVGSSDNNKIISLEIVTFTQVAVFLCSKGGAILEVKINKEIRNYTESMFFGLSLRQFVFSVLACGVAVGEPSPKK